MYLVYNRVFDRKLNWSPKGTFATSGEKRGFYHTAIIVCYALKFKCTPEWLTKNVKYYFLLIVLAEKHELCANKFFGKLLEWYNINIKGLIDMWNSQFFVQYNTKNATYYNCHWFAIAVKYYLNSLIPSDLSWEVQRLGGWLWIHIL